METGMQNAIEQMKQKEDAGLQYLYSKTYNFVYLRLKSMIKNEETIREVMQQVYSQAYESAEYLSEDKIYEWLGKTVYTLGSQSVKKRKEREASFIEIEENEIHSDEKVDLKKSAEVICQALDELPELYRATVFAFYYDQLEIKEIAIMMGCSTGVIKNRLNYARKYMIKVLQDYAEDEELKDSLEQIETEEPKVQTEKPKFKKPEEAKEEKTEEVSESEEVEEEKPQEDKPEEAKEEKVEESEEPEEAKEEKAEEAEEEKVEEVSEPEEAEPEGTEELKAEEPKRRFVKPKQPKPGKVLFTVETFSMAVRKWADENCLGLTIAQKVNRDICQAENLTPGVLQIDGKEFAGAKQTIVPHGINERTKVEEELYRYQRKQKETFLEEKRIDKRWVIGIAAGLLIVIGIAAGAVLWQGRKENPPVVKKEEPKEPKPNITKEEPKEPEVKEPEKPKEDTDDLKKPEDDNKAGQTADKNTAGNTTTENNKPSGSSTAGNSKPSNNSTTVNRKPSGSSATVNRKPSTNSTTTNRKPSGSSTTVNRKPSTSTATGNRKPSGSSTTGNKKPSGSSTAGNKKPSGSKPGNSSSSVNKNDDKYYVCPKSDRELLKEADLRKLTKEELRIARNEIYARHGMKFRRKELREYFEKLPWYKPKYMAEEFYEKIKLSKIEEKNVALILKIEKELS